MFCTTTTRLDLKLKSVVKGRPNMIMLIWLNHDPF